MPEKFLHEGSKGSEEFCLTPRCLQPLSASLPRRSSERRRVRFPIFLAGRGAGVRACGLGRRPAATEGNPHRDGAGTRRRGRPRYGSAALFTGFHVVYHVSRCRAAPSFSQKNGSNLRRVHAESMASPLRRDTEKPGVPAALKPGMRPAFGIPTGCNHSARRCPRRAGYAGSNAALSHNSERS
jgi:hypothetical protein